MTRRIILILVGALLILALMFALWFWLFGKKADVEENLGGFGTADDRGAGGGTGTFDGNTQTVIGGTNDTQPGGGGGDNIQTPLYVTPTYVPPDSGAPSSPGDFDDGVDWLDGSDGASGGGGVAFDPTPINQINNVSIEGTAYFNSSASGGSGGSGGIGLGGSLLGVAGGCAAQYATQKLAVGAVNGIKSAAGSLVSKIPVVGNFLAGLFGGGGEVVSDPETHTNQEVDTFIECMVRALARIAIQQLTAQTVAWINSGFNGEPAFVQDFGKFFNDVADRAAGQVIQGGDLAFLCSPFQLQVRIAIAQSYARRSSSAAAQQACTLTDVVGNVENFMRGDFSQGGWPGLISFTTVPTNNPVGAYASAQVLLNSRIAGETKFAELKISPGGFLPQEKCVTDQDTGEKIWQTITPGSTFEAALVSKFGAEVQGLQLAQSIDEILSALINSLTTNIFQKGLANLNSRDLGGQATAQDAQAVGEAGELLRALQAAVQRAQQYGSTQQGSIVDIQNTQNNLATLQDCWEGRSSSQADEAEAQIQVLETRIPPYNNNITRANAALARIQQIQTQALSASNLAQVRAAAAALTQAESSGALITSAEIVSAQQNRTTLQSEMASINQQTSAELNQCYAS